MPQQPKRRRAFSLRTLFVVTTLSGISLAVIAWTMTSKRAVIGAELQTCARCQSTRFLMRGGWTVYYKSPTFATCQHLWEDGVSNAMNTPISDGVVVLVRKGNAFGAFIPSSQSGWPEETLKYKWYLRADGCGTFGEADLQVESGEKAGKPVQFGPFSIGWSTHGPGSGWLYYDKGSGDPIAPNELRIMRHNRNGNWRNRCLQLEMDLQSVASRFGNCRGSDGQLATL